MSCLHALPASHPVMFVRCTRKKAKEMSGNENADERMFVGQQILQGHTFLYQIIISISKFLSKPAPNQFIVDIKIFQAFEISIYR